MPEHKLHESRNHIYLVPSAQLTGWLSEQCSERNVGFSMATEWAKHRSSTRGERQCFWELPHIVHYEQTADISEAGTVPINVRESGVKKPIWNVSVYSKTIFRIVYSPWFLPSLSSMCRSSSIVYHSHVMFLLSGRSSVPLGIISNPTQEISAT